MSYALRQTVTLTTLECSECGTTYAMSERVRAEKQTHGGTFYCPNGHSQVYKTTEVDRMRKMLQEANAQTTRLADDLQKEYAARVKIEKQMNRVKRGVCPCCNRTFANLARHMASKHKDQA